MCCIKFTTKEYPLDVLKEFKEDYLLLQREVKRLRLVESMMDNHGNLLSIKEF